MQDSSVRSGCSEHADPWRGQSAWIGFRWQRRVGRLGLPGLLAAAGFAWLLLVPWAPALGAEDGLEGMGTREHPLEPPDTSSPRATLQTFLEDVREGWRYLETHGRRRPVASRRANRCLDLSQVPPAQREDVGSEASLYLFDVLNRIPIPPLREVPDAEEMKQREQSRWVLPRTPIAIARVEEGSRAGEWLFTPETVRRARAFYQATRQLPVKPGPFGEDLSQIDLAIPGWMIPPGWIAALPLWSRHVYYEQTLWQWSLSGLMVGLAGLLAWVAVRGSRRPAPGEPPSPAHTLVGPVSVFLLASAVLYLIDEQVNLTGAVLSVAQTLLDAIRYLAIAWGLVAAGSLAVAWIRSSSRLRFDPLKAQLGMLGVRLVILGLVLLVAGLWASSLGLPVAAVITGLGVGGIAVALGAQRIFENLFAAFTLYADQPVRVGDVCRFGDQVGTVEHIGLRSTRIRTPERSIVTVPNADFAASQLENLALRERRRFRAILQLTQETSVEQIQQVLRRLREILAADEAVDPSQMRVRFVEVASDSLDLEAIAYVKTSEEDAFLAVKERLLMQMLSAVDEAGTTLATPERIVHLRSDESERV